MLALGAAGLVAVSCSSPSAPLTTYERIVVETYPAILGNTTETYIDLFGSAGDPDADDPWTGDDTGDALAYASGGAPIDHASYSLIDYTGGLTSGTYYVRVRGKTEGVTGPYVLRVLSLSLGEPVPAYVYPGVFANPDPYETDDNPPSGGKPTDPVPIDLGSDNGINRWLDYDTEGDVDWFQLVLP
jgi:hypothetical protein